jgi:hypothetical protein
MTYSEYTMISVSMDWSFASRPLTVRAGHQEMLSSISFHSEFSLIALPTEGCFDLFVTEIFNEKVFTQEGSESVEGVDVILWGLRAKMACPNRDLGYMRPQLSHLLL